MKKIILSLLTFVVVGTAAKVKAQSCAVQNVIVDIKNTSIVPAGLQVEFDVTFDLDANGGNKAIFIQTWLTSQYPNYWQCQSGAAQLNPLKAPKAANLANAFLRLAINNNGAQPAAYASYIFDPAATLTTFSGISKVQVTVNGILYDRFTLVSVQVVVPGITSLTDPVDVTTDVFSTNGTPSGPNSPIHCVNCGSRQFFNDPRVFGVVPCSVPRVVTFNVESDQLNTQFYYRIYQDDGDGVFEKGGADVDVTVGTNPTVTTNGSGVIASANYPIVQPGVGVPLGSYFVELIKVGTTFGVVQKVDPLPGIECAALPVSFKSFTASRNRSNVLLKWETSTEINNDGFMIERNIGGRWEDVSYVPSQAQGGNSDVVLTYTFNDLNTTKGISQYRLRQVDFDGKTKLSDIRAVRGEGQLGKTVIFPNPSFNGNATIVFEDANVKRDVSVIDMSGKIIKQWRSVSNNNLQIENLPLGVFSVRIIAVETGEQVVEKIVVNKR